MSIASIDLAEMAGLVTAMENAAQDISDRRGRLNGELTGVYLSTDELNRLDGVESWIEDELPGLRRRLALARHIEAQAPGLQAYVQLDESTIPTTTPEEARERADEAADLIEEYDDGEPPQELVDLLAENATDPYFAQQLATRVSPEELADFITGASSTRRQMAGATMSSDVEEVESFDTAYEATLDGLGIAFGTATQSTGDLALPDDYAASWSSAIMEESPEVLGQASALGLVISRGTFSADFLTTVATDVYQYEQALDEDDMWWKRAHSEMGGDGYGAIDPVHGDDEGAPTGYTEYYDPLAGIMAAVGRTPEAGHNLFGSGTVTEIEAGDESGTVNEFLDYVLARRRWPVDDGAGADAAIAAAITPFEGGSTISADIAGDAHEILTVKAAEIEERREDSNPFSDIGHLVLDGLGLIPVLGEPADAINALWYAAEGNVVDAGLSAAGMLPFMGWGATGGRWVRRALNADELAALRQADGLDEIPEGMDGIARADDLEIKLSDTDRLALTDYTGPGYRDMNNALRNTDADIPADLQARIDRVSAALANLPAHPGTTYRGVDLPDDVLARYQPGETVPERGFTSTSTDPSVAEGAFDGNVIFIVEGRTGRDVAPYSEFPNEAEILYNAGTEFEVMDRVFDEDMGKWVIRVREAT
ncbi:ADP-ribosyltransferase [Jiangella alkaliphila]|uniref:ADP-ribosyltransferase exoenzyme n=1 Tax=Jiangella alkaliphila TaxID=419479 RepID=A0A1H2KHV2_9ACTN|nr:DUF6571 family protein [Jiangella alkaliphila]SDU68287.1 ADP-ribosyltransferase exoenzyme [Jiangella alkaliphila]